jgi:glycosyltransferase involved in cell wall biosynthesis
MGLFFASLFLSCVILIIIHIIFVGINSFQWAVNGVDVIIKGNTFIETVYYSSYLKWIGLADIIWFFMLGIFLFNQKRFKTNLNLHYLSYNKIKEPKICVVIPAHNEENNIKQVVTDFIKQKNVKHVIVIDNNSIDNTVDIAKKSGATVITKNQNMGYGHSFYIGLKESLKMEDVNVTVLCDADLTYSAYDLEKMIPYLDNCDMVLGNRLVQVLSQKGNQNSPFLVWGNAFIAKLLQFKYFSIIHLGIIQINDVGCSYRCIRKESLQKIIDDFTHLNSEKLAFGANTVTIGMFTIVKAIEHDLKIVEIPITFKKREGISKTQASKIQFALKYGLQMIWYILKS